IDLVHALPEVAANQVGRRIQLVDLLRREVQVLLHSRRLVQRVRKASRLWRRTDRARSRVLAMNGRAQHEREYGAEGIGGSHGETSCSRAKSDWAELSDAIDVPHVEPGNRRYFDGTEVR